jgi:tRNA(Ile)-lysidine synthetase-like protein
VGGRAEAGSRPAGLDLKSLLRESGIPVWQRDEVPLVWEGRKLIAVADLWHDASLQSLRRSATAGRFIWRHG